MEREACDGCGFIWDEPTSEEILDRLGRAADGHLAVLTATGPDLGARPAPEVWSPLEYAGHVRDVLLNLRDRIIVGLAEDDPRPKSMYGTLRIERGMYRHDTPAQLALELSAATRLLVATVSVLTTDELERPVFYPWPRPATRTLHWVAAQALHESEHHLADIEALIS